MILHRKDCMTENIDDIIKRITEKHLEVPSEPSKSRSRLAETCGSFFRRHKKGSLIAFLCISIAGTVLYVLLADFLTKRQNYPERNVLFRAMSVMEITGTEGKKEKDVDKQCDTLVYAGGTVSKVGTYQLRTVREVREDIEYFNMDDMQKIRIASATRKSEAVQAGLRVGGSLNFKEQFAEIILTRESKALQSYHVYKFVPERGLNEVEVAVVRKEDGKTTVVNRMIEMRESLIGWMWGKEFRAGTFLEQYVQSPENEKLMEDFHAAIETLDSMRTVNKSEREKIIKHAESLSERMETRPVCMSYEDGLFDLIPQESTIYLAHKPGLWERVKDSIVGKSEQIRLRVENHWDLYPGRYPVLKNFSVGSGENIVHPFDKYNNGGYTIKDKYGDLARIEIEDFILFHGQDVVYSYYLDIGGDGKIDRETELMGTVLFRTTRDERVGLESMEEKRPEKSAKFTIHYSFMAPDDDVEKGLEYFRFCGYIESMMPDQVNRGFGKHSMLGYINRQRSDIMLFKDMSIENMSRALTEESNLVAKFDIVRALIAAKRPYARQIAEAFGVAEDFEGKYQESDRLIERRDLTFVIEIPAWILLIGCIVFWAVRKKKNISGP